jgi:hypothetical protein
MNILEKIVAKKELKSALERLSKKEIIELNKIRLKFNLHPEGELKFFIMNGAESKKESSIYTILELNGQNETHKNIVSRVKKKLIDMIEKTSIEKSFLISDIDARFYLANDENQRLTKLSMYLFNNNAAVEALDIDKIFSK